MASYVMLMNWTEQGIKNVKDWPARTADARKGLEALGAKLSSIHMTMGAYDLVAIVDGIEDEAMAKFALALGQRGNVRTTTLRAFSEAEAATIATSL